MGFAKGDARTSSEEGWYMKKRIHLLLTNYQEMKRDKITIFNTLECNHLYIKKTWNSSKSQNLSCELC